MLNTNEYFEGKVKSIALTNNRGKSTIGAMDIGEYEFDTTTVEHMTVVSGTLIVKLPGVPEWKKYAAGESFTVAANQRFGVRVEEQTAYICLYQ
jgi:purine/pyrimidine-nucleoside phosphorylase